VDCSLNENYKSFGALNMFIRWPKKRNKISTVMIGDRAIIPLSKIHFIGIENLGSSWRVSIYCGNNIVITDCENEKQALDAVEELHEAIRNYYA
jgi:hypothetical protein